MTPRYAAAIMLAALVSLFSIGRLLMDTSDLYAAEKKTADPVSQFTNRFEPVRAMLPESGVLGYITDPSSVVDPATARAEFQLVQYALAPIVVDDSAAHRYVVSNFHTLVTTGSLADRGLRLIREFGNGVALLENAKAAR